MRYWINTFWSRIGQNLLQPNLNGVNVFPYKLSVSFSLISAPDNGRASGI